MQTSTSTERAAIRCGYEPPVPSARGWSPEVGASAEVCPGYACNLPTVIEVSRLRVHWSNGALREALADAAPTTQVMDAILLLDGQIAASDANEATKPPGAR